MAKWVSEAMQTHHDARFSNIDEDLALLSIPPSFTTLTYKKMKAYGNHFQIDDEHIDFFTTFDCGVASIFQQSQEDEDNMLGTI